ncbi:hypothetical protein [Nesterenkonia sp. K-15-9-6]|uniref:hypothetical protein n=1 Tax=Nesterenkonia sp. K-15-9-6 TaxID=3093918 RepID=UPI004044653C
MNPASKYIAALAALALLLSSCGANDDAEPEAPETTTEAAEPEPAADDEPEDEQPDEADRPDELIERENEAATILFNMDGQATGEETAAAEVDIEEVYTELDDEYGHLPDDEFPEWFEDLVLYSAVAALGGTFRQMMDDELPDEVDNDNPLTREFLGCEDDETITECEDRYEREFMESVPEEWRTENTEEPAEDTQEAAAEDLVPVEEIAEYAPGWPAGEPMTYDQLELIKEEQRLWDEWDQAEPGSPEAEDLERQIEEIQNSW